MRLTPLFSVILASTVTGASAEGKRQLDAHRHGHGTLNMAIEGKTLHMELEAPGADIAGFEHAAETAAQKASVKAAEKKLAAPLTLFALPGEAGCEVASAKVSLSGESDHEREKHSHGHESAGVSHKEQAREEDHSEFRAEYALTCANMDAITTIRFPYFDAFPNAEELAVTLITEKGQKAFEVSRSNPVIDIQGMM
jgi:hypothetical protein